MNYAASSQEKFKSIAEMAMDYTSMSRVFRTGSKKVISKKLFELLKSLNSMDSETKYRQQHKNFCNWFLSTIYLAKSNTHATYGHAAKVFDICMKVFVYYCNLPSSHQAKRILPWLNGAVDRPIIHYLRKRNNFMGDYSSLKSVSSIKSIDLDKYILLQKVIRVKSATEGLLPVQWEEKTWRLLNR